MFFAIHSCKQFFKTFFAKLITEILGGMQSWHKCSILECRPKINPYLICDFVTTREQYHLLPFFKICTAPKTFENN